MRSRLRALPSQAGLLGSTGDPTEARQQPGHCPPTQPLPPIGPPTAQPHRLCCLRRTDPVRQARLPASSIRNHLDALLKHGVFKLRHYPPPERSWCGWRSKRPSGASVELDLLRIPPFAGRLGTEPHQPTAERRFAGRLETVPHQGTAATRHEPRRPRFQAMTATPRTTSSTVCQRKRGSRRSDGAGARMASHR
jgi:hypothetical protein